LGRTALGALVTGARSRSLALIDRCHRARSVPDRFRLRFAVGACFLGLALAAATLVVAVAEGDPVTAVVNGVFLGLLLVQLGAIRLGAPSSVIMWTILGTVASYFLAMSLGTSELRPDHPLLFLLLPLAARAFEEPTSSDAGPVRYLRAPLLALASAIVLGVFVIVAHEAGLTFGQPVPEAQPWTHYADFFLFTVAASGLVIIHDLSERESQLELRQLRRLLRVCAWCKKVHDRDEWVSFEHYLSEHKAQDLTHGICPTCLAEVRGRTAATRS